MIHYLSDLSHLFKDIGKVLKAGGIFAFSTHHPWVDFQSSPSGNYFECELITEEWGTVGKPVEVSYYRRPMSAIFQAIKESDMCVIDLTEGKPNPELEEISNRHFKKLSTKPTFIFVKCSRITNNNPKIAK